MKGDMMNTLEELRNMIDGRQGIIAVRTHEHERVLKEIWDIASENGTTLLTWTVTNGVRKVDAVETIVDGNTLVTRGYREANDGLEDPGMYKIPPGAIRAAMDYKLRGTKNGNDTVVMVAINLHHWYKQPEIQQWLLDASDLFLRQRRALILLGPVCDLPDEVSKVVTVVDWPLPSYEEISSQVLGYIAAVNRAGTYDHIDLGDGLQSLVRALQGMTVTEIKHTLNMLLITYRTINTQPDSMELVIDRKSRIVRATRALEYVRPDENMDSIGGLTALKQFIDEVAGVYSDEAEAYGAVPPAGMLAIGPPGTGKSLAAKCVANRFKVPLVRMDAGSLFSSLVGSSEETVRQALAVTEAVAPCVLWIDEADKGLGGGGGELDGGTSQRVFATILHWMQERARQKRVFVVMTSNSAQRIDLPLLQRVEQFCVWLPGRKARAEIFDIHLRKNGRANWSELGIDVNTLAAVTDGYAGREIESAVLSAIRKAFRAVLQDGYQGNITQDMLMEAVHEIVPLSHSMKNGLAEIEAWAQNARSADGPNDDEGDYTVFDGDLLPD